MDSATTASTDCATKWSTASRIALAVASSRIVTLSPYPAARAAFSRPSIVWAGPYWLMFTVTSPIVRVDPVTSARAATFGR